MLQASRFYHEPLSHNIRPLTMVDQAFMPLFFLSYQISLDQLLYSSDLQAIRVFEG